MPKLDLESIETTNHTGYPSPYCEPMAKRHYRRLGEPAGLRDFRVTHVRLDPGGISSQRHWHEEEDEFLVMIDGEAMLVEEDVETLLRAGDCAAFPKGVANGHHLVNRGVKPCLFVVVGRNAESDCHYPDIDIHFDAAAGRYTRKDGSEFPV